MEIKDKVIVVTGAASGIGKALANRFSSEGARQVVAVDVNAEGAETTAHDIGGASMVADVSREEDVARGIKITENEFGQIDLFCSNAGVGAAPDYDRWLGGMNRLYMRLTGQS